MKLFFLGAALICLCSGCDRDRPTPPAAPAPPTTTAATSSPPVASGKAYSEHTGILSEGAFKKLHELKADVAPPRRGSMVKLDAERAYLSTPPGAKPPLPTVIVIHEWWGLNEHIMHWSDRLAADGYAALAVDLFGGEVATTPDQAMQLIKAVDAAKAKATLLAAHDFAEKDARTKASRTAAIGWCFGGKWALELAIAEPDVDATVAYYGHVTTEVDRLKHIRGPVLAIFGTKDESIPATHVDEFDQALGTAKVTHQVLRYDADHAFANPSGKRYDEKAATEAWKQARAFLAEHLAQRPR
jgi:carboxymethylenebutenolidase